MSIVSLFSGVSPSTGYHERSLKAHLDFLCETSTTFAFVPNIDSSRHRVSFASIRLAELQENDSRCHIFTQSNIIIEMGERSSLGGLNERSVGMDVSPMSSIVNDLSRSILDSGGKRHLQSSRGKSQL